jgi:hypothetical protein
MRIKYGEISSTKIEHNGTIRTLVEWAEVMGVDYPTVRMRYKRGKRSFADLFDTPTDKVYSTPKVNNAEKRRNLVARVEKLESRLEALKTVVLQITERINI